MDSFGGLGEKRPVGYVVDGVVRHFQSLDSSRSLCGVELDLVSDDDDDWVSCLRCMKASRAVQERNS